MASQLWSWIFIIQFMLVRPGFAHVSHNYEVLTRRAFGKVFARSLSKSETTRNTFVALAIAAGVVLLAGLLGLFLFIRRAKMQKKVSEPESGAVTGKPSWWMVEGKNEKMDWWRLSHRIEPAVGAGVEATKPIEGGRIARLKAAIQRQAGKGQQPLLPTHRSATPSPTDSLGLPMQTNPNIEPRYPDSLERGYRAPIYQVQSPPQIPALYIGDRPLKQSPTTPPRAIVTHGQRATLARCGARTGAPRSPAGRRWLNRHSFRHPFLPLKDSDAPLPKISAPVPITHIDPTNPKLNYAPSLSKPRAAPTPPEGPRGSLIPPVPVKARKFPPPAPLNLQNSQQPLSAARVSAARVRVGLPASPRPPRNINSAA
ncbi:hypothetical protein BDZ97DRAFT_1774635 [Flammula alnicola]|nr:hypothetical protein BDZ97DRAFT_1774635 [Flammula alnicola]